MTVRPDPPRPNRITIEKGERGFAMYEGHGGFEGVAGVASFFSTLEELCARLEDLFSEEETS